jgi:hypothetical protein
MSPRRTRSPSATGSRTTRPPISGASEARRRAVTVPALLLVISSSTDPIATRTTLTGTTAGWK